MNWRPVRSRGYSPPPTSNRRAATPDRICLPPQEMESVYWVPRCNSHPNTLPVPSQLVVMRPGQRIPRTVTIPNDFHHSDCDPATTYLMSRYPETNNPQDLRPPCTNDPDAQTENRSDPSTPLNQNLLSGAQTHHPASRSNEQPGSAHKEVTCTHSPQIASQHQRSSSHGDIQHSLDLSDSDASLVQQTNALQAHIAHQVAAISLTSVLLRHSAELTLSPRKIYHPLQVLFSAPQTHELYRPFSSRGENQQLLELPGQEQDTSVSSALDSSIVRQGDIPQDGAHQVAANTLLGVSSGTYTELTSPLHQTQQPPNPEYQPDSLRLENNLPDLNNISGQQQSSKPEATNADTAHRVATIPPTSVPSGHSAESMPSPRNIQLFQVPTSASKTREVIHGQSFSLGKSEQLLELPGREQDTVASLERDSSLVRQGEILQDGAIEVAANTPAGVSSRCSTESTSPLHKTQRPQVPTSASKTREVIHGQSSSLGKSDQLLELPGREQDTSASSERDSSLIGQGEILQDGVHQVAANTPAGVSSGCSTESTSPLHKIQQPQKPKNIPERLRRENTSDPNNIFDQQHSIGPGAAVANAFSVNGGSSAHFTIKDSPIYVLSVSGVNSDIADKTSNTSSTSSEENEDKFLEFCKNVTEKNTEHDVRSAFDSFLSTPTKEINPVYLRTAYYSGDTELSSSVYRPDDLYEHHSQRENKGEKVKIEQLVDKGQFVALIGDAGAGKTTTAKRFAQLVNSSKIQSLQDIKLVLFIKFAQVQSSDKYDVFQLIFAKILGTELTTQLKEYGREWVRKNSKKILLVMDGLDQADWKFGEKKDQKLISYDEEATAPCIFFNVLKNNLLPDCKILITCREHAIRNCPRKICPDATIAVTGLAPEDRDYLITQLAGDQGERILNHLRTRAPGLLSLCQTPMFLVSTTAVLTRDLENAPETMTGIFFRILVLFKHSENQRVEEEDAETVFKKLKHLAFDGITKQKVTFEATELSKYGLDVNQVQDLVLVVPNSDAQGFHLMGTKFQNIFFCHQLIQETLAALFICEMALNDFKDFIWNNFDSSHFSVVRAIVLGILLNPNMAASICKSIIGDISEKQQKVEALKDWLEAIFNNRVKEEAQRDKNILNLASENDDVWFKLLYECGDGINDILKKHLHSVDTTQRNFEGDILHMVTSVMSRCSAISQANFLFMTLRNGDVDKFVGALAPCNSLEVFRMQLDKINNQEAKQLLKALDRTKKKTCVGMDDREPDNQIAVLMLELRHSECIDYQVVGLLQVCQVEQLFIADCVIKRQQNEERVNAFGEAKINVRILCLGKNEHLDYKLVADLLQLCQFLELLDLSHSNIAPQQMEDLIGELGKAKINLKVLNLDGNKHLDFKLVAQLLQVCQVSGTLSLMNCDIKSQQIEEFIQGFGKANINLKRLTLCGNEHLDYKLLAQLLQVCQVSEMLDLSVCEIKLLQLEELIQGLGEAKFNIKDLALRMNRDLDYNRVGKLTRVLGVENLDLTHCDTTRQNVDELIEGHGEARINLKIKDFFRAGNEYLSPANFKNEIEE